MGVSVRARGKPGGRGDTPLPFEEVGLFTRFVSAEAKHMRWLHVNVEESLCLFVSNSLFRDIIWGKSWNSRPHLPWLK